MMRVERALLIINKTAGTGQNESVAAELTRLFKQALSELSQIEVELVSNHAAARTCAAKFVSESEVPAVVVAGGGGGTLRAVIEGICDSGTSTQLPGPERVRVGALRMGSGNVLAKQFGVPRDPVAGLNGLLVNLKAGRMEPCCVMRCEIRTRSGNAEVRHAVTLGGLGQFGRVPSDLARWHAQFPFLHKTAARLLGVEKFTNVEYALALLVRFVRCMLFPDYAEEVEVRLGNRKENMRLLSGIVMNFPIPALPFKPGVIVADEAVSVYLISLRGRCRRLRIEKGQRLEVQFIDREEVEFFLDEDPITTYKQLSLGVAGSIAFVPGPDYQ